VLSWQTAPLDHDVVIRGDIAAHLFASTTGAMRMDREADRRLSGGLFQPQHDRRLPAHGRQRRAAGRFRAGFERPEPIAPNRVLEYVVISTARITAS